MTARCFLREAKALVSYWLQYDYSVLCWRGLARSGRSGHKPTQQLLYEWEFEPGISSTAGMTWAKGPSLLGGGRYLSEQWFATRVLCPAPPMLPELVGMVQHLSPCRSSHSGRSCAHLLRYCLGEALKEQGMKGSSSHETSLSVRATVPPFCFLFQESNDHPQALQSSLPSRALCITPCPATHPLGSFDEWCRIQEINKSLRLI